VFSRILIRMGMRGIGIIVFLLILLFCECLLMGCSSLPFTDKPQQESVRDTNGFSSGNVTSYILEYTNFADALADLVQIEYGGTQNETSNGTFERGILYIRGDKVDATGNASSWMFVVRDGNETSFVTYTHNGRSIAGWSAGFNGTIVPDDKILPVTDLFDRNSAVLSGGQASDSTGSWEVIMEHGNYSLTRSGTEKSRTLVFNATNGVLIASYDT